MSTFTKGKNNAPMFLGLDCRWCMCSLEETCCIYFCGLQPRINWIFLHPVAGLISSGACNISYLFCWFRQRSRDLIFYLSITNHKFCISQSSTVLLCTQNIRPSNIYIYLCNCTLRCTTPLYPALLQFTLLWNNILYATLIHSAPFYANTLYTAPLSTTLSA